MKIKEIIKTILAVIFIILFFIVGWFITIIFYPDEWFAEIPKIILELLGFKF